MNITYLDSYVLCTVPVDMVPGKTLLTWPKKLGFKRFAKFCISFIIKDIFIEQIFNFY